MSAFLAPEPPPGTAALAGPPTFSVVIAAYQAAATIGEALDSALGQTMPPVDIVICYDGSTDDLAGALAPYAGRVTLLRQANAGEAAAKTRAIEAAQGEFAVIHDADDVFLPTRLEALGDLARRRPDLDVITTDAMLEVAGRPVRRCYHPGFPFEVDDQRTAILTRNFVFGLAAVRRERVLEIGGLDAGIRYATDWDLWLRLILSGSRVGLVPEALARYRISAGNLSSQRAAMTAGGLQVLRKARGSAGLTAGERQALERAVDEHERRLAVERARELLAAGAPGRRRASLHVVAGHGHGPATRAKALVAAVAPAVAGRRIAGRPRELTAGLRSDA